jgi:ankyrin repeat protein
MPNKTGKCKAKAAGIRQRSVKEINKALLHASQFNIVTSNDANVLSAQAAIDAGADVNYSEDGVSCLMVASALGCVKIIVLLLNGGADTEANNEVGDTALTVAAQGGKADSIQLLLNAGADIEAEQIGRFSALLIAAQLRRAGCLQLLLRAGADRNARDQEGSTALYISAQRGHIECI